MPIGSHKALLKRPSISVGSLQTTTFDPANLGSQLGLADSNKTLLGVSAGGVANFESGLITTSKTTGKFYFEFLIKGLTAGKEASMLFGFCLNNQNTGAYLTQTGDAGFVRAESGTVGAGSGIITFTSANVPTYTAAVGDTIGFALDFTAGKGWVAYNNTFGGSPAAGTNSAFTWTTGSPFFAATSINYNGDHAAQMTFKCAGSTVKYTPPSGFSTWD